MIVKYRLYLNCFFVLQVLISGCRKNLELAPPVTQLVTASVFSDNGTATAAQLGVYSQMSGGNDLANIDRMTGLSSDELNTYSTDQTSRDIYTNALNATIDAASGILNEWSPAYNYIYQENALLEGLSTSSLISANVKIQLKGEAQFLRSFWYFYLVNLYGDVPLITNTDYKANSSKANTPKAQVYQQIISDLRSAENSLSSYYLDATDTTPTVDRVRPTKWSAAALLARIYLYNGKYDSSETESTVVINNSSLFELTSLDSVFLANSMEAIWQIMPSMNGGYTPEGGFFVLVNPPTTSGGGIGGTSVISSQLLNAFETNDMRKTSWIGSFTNGSDSWFFPYKYKGGPNSPSPPTEYSMVLRLGEQFLIRSEARAQQNNLFGAISDLNIIRARAGLTSLPFSLSQTQILLAITHERQVELFTEGHRWIDLKRTVTVDAVMGGSTGVCQEKGGSWNSNQQLYPIILTDLQNDINLKQNPGY